MPQIELARTSRVVIIAMLALALSLVAAACQARPDKAALSPDGLPQRLILAVDGIPYDLFVELQAQQHFAGFRPAARMVAPFPSLSDVSFAAIGGSPPPEGYQVLRFDQKTNRVVGNTLGSLSSRAHANLPADSSPHSSWHRMIGYLTAYHMALHDLRKIRKQVLASRQSTFVAYLEQSDAVLHVEGRAGATKLLLQIDLFLGDLQAQVRARTGRELLVDIVSDHGSTLLTGRNVDLEKQLRSCGYRRRSRIDSADQVAYSLAGIIGFVAVNARPERVEDVARCLAATDGVELVAVDRAERVAILSADGGRAELWPTPGANTAFSYRNLRGDPLGLLAGEVGPVTRSFDEDLLFRRTLDAPYPDPLRRLWRAFHGAVREPSPILLSLRDGRDAGYRTVRSFAALRGRAGTHGSLTRRASLGIFTSNWRAVDDVDSWGAHDALFGPGVAAAVQSRADGWLSNSGPVSAAQGPVGR